MEIQIRWLRGSRILLDHDLASLYGVPTMVLNQAVRRNIQRFPDDFMFQLTPAEAANLKSQFVISSWGGRRRLPWAFTEQGVAMLSGLLRSERAIQANIAIMRAFVRMRNLLVSRRRMERHRRSLETWLLSHETSFGREAGELRRLLKLLDELGAGAEKPK